LSSPTSGSRTSVARAVQAPPWLARLFFPLIARHAASELARQHPDLTPEQIGEKMRADLPANAEPHLHEMVDAVVARLPPKAAPGARPASYSRLSAALLVLVNLVPLYGVLAWNWDVFPLLVLFWAENVIVGVLNAARMLCIDPADPLLWGTKLFLVPFFCLHYGLFTAGHGVFVLSGMFGGQGYRVEGLNPLGAALAAFRDYDLWLAAGLLAASHLFSFFWNYLRGREYLRARLKPLMHQPYVRVILLHLTIIFGGMTTIALGSPVWALVLLIAMKVAIDVTAHLKEHRAA
jgi:hypothetical protein